MLSRRALMAAAGLALAGAAGAAPFTLQPRIEGLSERSATNRVEITAREMEYERPRGIVRAVGNVVVRRGSEVLTADSVTVDTIANEIVATGHVAFATDGARWQGDAIHYNLDTREWRTGAFVAFLDPFHVRSASAASTNRVVYLLQRAMITTCALPYPHYHYSVSARRVRFVSEEYLTAQSAVLRFGRVPVLYLPWFYQNLRDRSVGYSAKAGYRDRMGLFLLNSVRYNLSRDLRAATHLDIRTARGVGVGQDIGWTVDQDMGQGSASVYYADDPKVEDEHKGSERELVNRARYRLRVSDEERLTERTYFMGNAGYLSDPFLMEDFFDQEHRASYQPDNFLSLQHSADWYSAGILVTKRLNDFFTAVDRLPELTVEFPRQPLGGWPVYYEGENHVGYLRKLWAKGSSTTRDDYDALRVDSAHMLSYPTRQFGFLTVIPRAGFRGTFYSQTVRRETVAEVREVVTTNTPDVGPPQIETRTVTNRVERDAEAGPGFRPLFEVGCETSFKAFGVWTEGETLFGRGLRHVVSPYANYTLVPRPGLTPSETCQFDEIDALGQDHSVRLGLVNELQTRRPDLLNLVYLDTYTTYRFVGAAGEPFGDLHWDAEFHFLDDLSLRTDGGFNVYHGVFDVLDFRALYAPPRWRAGVEYRFRDDSMSLLSGSLSVSPIRGWTFEAAGRYEFEGGRLEEHSYGITRTLDCMVIHSGLRHIPAYTRSDGSRREDEFRVEFQLWLTAFPDVRLAIRSRD